VRYPWDKTTTPITTVDEYSGQRVLRISATQLGAKYTAHRARKIVDDWCEFFSSGPTPIVELSFASRTPKRLFESLAAKFS
jgi:nucleoside diphosphate kinase